MNDQINYQNNPLHGVSLKNLLIEIVDHYGFEILYAYLNINCFKTKPSIESSVKFLKKTDWAREKVEAFYLYQFKSLPKASGKQFALPPRDRIIPADQSPGEPAVLSLEDAERLRARQAEKTAAFGRGGRPQRAGQPSSGRPAARSEQHPPAHSKRAETTEKHDKPAAGAKIDPWAKARKAAE
ncbi:MAG: VF530 family protein [Saccharospirillaceae bacterium]|nr:VF530 family protein [Saccharospirillaceae bacterium]MCD8532363.1 VF530 family protein [Saccharospirillaceae bacterium]